LELRRGSEGVDGVQILLSGVAMPVGFVRLGALEDHEVALGLGELIVFLLGVVRRVIDLRGRLLGLTLLAKNATDVALHGCAVLEKMLHLPPMERARGLERILEVFRSCSASTRLRSGNAVGHGDHLLPATLLVLVPPVTASLG
jgi:hypothetical protein